MSSAFSGLLKLGQLTLEMAKSACEHTRQLSSMGIGGHLC